MDIDIDIENENENENKNEKIPQFLKLNFKDLFIYFDLEQLKLLEEKNKNINFYLEKENHNHNHNQNHNDNDNDNENDNQQSKLSISDLSESDLSKLINNNNDFKYKLFIKSFTAKSFIVMEIRNLSFNNSNINDNNSDFLSYYDDNFSKIFKDFKNFEIFSKSDMEYLLMIDYEEIEGISKENFDKNFIFYDQNKKLNWDEINSNLDKFLS
jgi:hypothetical protein